MQYWQDQFIWLIVLRNICVLLEIFLFLWAMSDFMHPSVLMSSLETGENSIWKPDVQETSYQKHPCLKYIHCNYITFPQTDQNKTKLNFTFKYLSLNKLSGWCCISEMELLRTETNSPLVGCKQQQLRWEIFHKFIFHSSLLIKSEINVF